MDCTTDPSDWLREIDADEDPPGIITNGGSANADKPSLVEYRRLTSAELDNAEFDLEYLIDNTFVAKQPCIMAGGHKAMKTSLMIDKAIALATGGHWLGYFPVRRAVRVGVMSAESGLATLQETARRICRSAGIRLADTGIVWSDSIPKFGHAAHLVAIRNFIEADELEVLCIDPAYLAMPTGNEGSIFAQGELLSSIATECQQAGCLLNLLHHTKRGVANPYAPPELADIAWSGFAEFARQWILLGRREPYTPGTGQHRLWLSVGGSAGHGGLYGVNIEEGTRETPGGRFWEVSILKADDIRKDADNQKAAAREQKQVEKLELDRRAIVDVINSFPDKVATKSDMRAITAMSGARFNIVLASLLKDKILAPTTTQKGRGKGREVEAYTPYPDTRTRHPDALSVQVS